MYDIQNPLSKLDYRQNPQLMPAPKPLPSAKIHHSLHPSSHPLHSAPVSKAVPSLASVLPGPASACCCERSNSSLVPTSAGIYRITELVSLHNVVFRASFQSVCDLPVQRPEADTVADIRTEVLEPRSVRAMHVRDTPYRQTGFVITSRKAIANIRVLALRLASFMLLRPVLNG